MLAKQTFTACVLPSGDIGQDCRLATYIGSASISFPSASRLKVNQLSFLDRCVKLIETPSQNNFLLHDIIG